MTPDAEREALQTRLVKLMLMENPAVRGKIILWLISDYGREVGGAEWSLAHANQESGKAT